MPSQGDCFTSHTTTAYDHVVKCLHDMNDENAFPTGRASFFLPIRSDAKQVYYSRQREKASLRPV